MKEARTLLVWADLVQPGVVWSTLVRLGIPGTEAYAMVANVIETSGAQQLIDQLYATPDGCRIMNQLARAWKDGDELPPWRIGQVAQ